MQHEHGKPERRLKGRCEHEVPKAKKARSFMCVAVPEESREKVFDEFWKLDSWLAKKAFVRGLVSTRAAKRRRKT